MPAAKSGITATSIKERVKRFLMLNMASLGLVIQESAD
jgi:hypothetical protein